MNVKPGDLAIIIKSFTGKYEGMIVKVIEAAPSLKYPNGEDYGNQWFVKSGSKFKYIQGGSGNIARIPDAWLRPVSGLPDAEHTDESEPIKELA